jgi:transcriptional regulator with PAS, ATPase and Fis domain
MDFYPGSYAVLKKENARLTREIKILRQKLQEAIEKLKGLQQKAEDPSRYLVKSPSQEIALNVERSASRRAYRFNYDSIIGESPSMRAIFETLDRVIDSDLPVLIQGESGTGKELVAQAIHYNSPRKDKKFVAENCGAIPDALLESELFGYVTGAFTGATHDKKGLFELADGGTLFLDEISNMSPDMQMKLLRVIETGIVRKVGASETFKVNTRIISASNVDLASLVEKGKFRKDLFYRLNTVIIQLPRLRDRKEDIPLLVDHFLQKAAKRMGAPPRRISPVILEMFLSFDWPGNVRELENEVYRLVALSPTEEIQPDLVSANIQSGGVPKLRSSLPPKPDKIDENTLRKAIANAEREVIMQALEHANGNRSKAAKLLGLSTAGLIKKMNRCGLSVVWKIKEKKSAEQPTSEPPNPKD